MATDAPVARTVLIVEDDDIFRARLARAFHDRGYEVRQAPDSEGALDSARDDPPEYAVVDLRLGTQSGLEVVRALAELDPTTAIVVLTGYGSIATALEAVRLGAKHYLAKPAEVDEIVAGFTRDVAIPPEIIDPAAAPSLARVEWEHINRVLSDCGGNVSKAARVLGIHRRSLQRKLSKFPSAR